MQVALFKKVGKYTDREGKERVSTRFYLRCGNALVPVEVPYFEGANGEKDNQYGSRKSILTAFADDLPDKDKSTSSSDNNRGNMPQV